MNEKEPNRTESLESELTELQIKIWKYHTAHGATITPSLVSQHFSIPESQAKKELEALDKAKIIQTPPSWSMITNCRLLKPHLGDAVSDLKDENSENKEQESKEQLSIEEKDEKDEKPKREPVPGIDELEKPEKESPPPKRKLIDKKKMESYRGKKHSSAQAHARLIVKKNSLQYEEAFKHCQLCGAENPEIYVPDDDLPHNINMLCHSCLIKERNNPKSPPTINLDKKIAEKNLRDGIYNEPEPRKYRHERTKSKLKRFKDRFRDDLPTLFCASCGVSSKKSQINTKALDDANPYDVLLLCPSCQNKLSRLEKLEMREKGATVDLYQLVGVIVDHERHYYQEDKSMSFIRKNKCKHELFCFVCGATTEDSWLYLEFIGSNAPYLTCEDCKPTAEEELKSGVGLINVDPVDLS